MTKPWRSAFVSLLATFTIASGCSSNRPYDPTNYLALSSSSEESLSQNLLPRNRSATARPDWFAEPRVAGGAIQDTRFDMMRMQFFGGDPHSGADAVDTGIVVYKEIEETLGTRRCTENIEARVRPDIAGTRLLFTIRPIEEWHPSCTPMLDFKY